MTDETTSTKPVTEKSCDKVITTFETTITWFDPQTNLPEDGSIILMKINNEEISSYGFFKTNPGFHENVKYWAYIPEIPEFE